jgi:uncharacterized protein (DUF2147 family)
MMHLTKRLVPALLALAFATAPALAADPTGVWQSADGEAQYKVTYCGDGTQLCARLTWLSDEARTEANLAYLNRLVVQGAVPVEDGEWAGALNYEGDTYEGRVRLLSDNALTLRGCKGMLCQVMNFERI